MTKCSPPISTSDRGLNQKQVADLLGVDRTTVYRLTNSDASFPRPARFGPRTIRWRRDELERWIDARQRPQPARPARLVRL